MKYIHIILIMLTLTSCEKFVDVDPKGLVIPEKLADYANLLNSPILTRSFPNEMLYLTDDYVTSHELTSQSAAANAYFWRHDISLDENEDPAIWGPLYKRIYFANVIINNVLEVEDGSETEKKSVLGEAYFHRAMAYMDLLTVYAKAYNPATASSDYGVPIPSGTNITGKTPERPSLSTNFESMISDLKLAISNLPDNNINKYRVNRYAAQALLARICLYMGDFEQALIYTNEALKAPLTLLNYNDYEGTTDVPAYAQNPEILFHREGIIGAPYFYLYSDDLKAFFDNNDRRYDLLTTTNNSGLGRSSFLGYYSYGIGLPELYLMKAELLARAGEKDPALKLVNDLRKKRIRSENYSDLIAQDAQEALMITMAERRRELAFGGLRWYDMKRLNQEDSMTTVTRKNMDTGAIEATLEAGSEHYVFEIPVRVRKFNPDIILNH